MFMFHISEHYENPVILMNSIILPGNMFYLSLHILSIHIKGRVTFVRSVRVMGVLGGPVRYR
jgi:hypothetical protein